MVAHPGPRARPAVRRRRRAAAARPGRGRAAAPDRRRRLRRLLVVDRAREELRADLPAGEGAAAGPMAPSADRLPRAVGHRGRQRHARAPPARPAARRRRRACVRSDGQARRRARARLRGRHPERDRRAGAGRPGARARLRRGAAQRLERPRPPGLGVPAARPAAGKVVRHLDLGLGGADGARSSRSAWTRRSRSPAAALPARGAVGTGHRPRDRAEPLAGGAHERPSPVLERRPADRPPDVQRRRPADR